MDKPLLFEGVDSKVDTDLSDALNNFLKNEMCWCKFPHGECRCESLRTNGTQWRLNQPKAAIENGVEPESSENQTSHSKGRIG